MSPPPATGRNTEPIITLVDGLLEGDHCVADILAKGNFGAKTGWEEWDTAAAAAVGFGGCGLLCHVVCFVGYQPISQTQQLPTSCVNSCTT